MERRLGRLVVFDSPHRLRRAAAQSGEGGGCTAQSEKPFHAAPPFSLASGAYRVKYVLRQVCIASSMYCVKGESEKTLLGSEL